MIKLSNSWVIMNPGGGPTPDKPDIPVIDYEAGNTVSSFINLRVADIARAMSSGARMGPSSSRADRSRRRDPLLYARPTTAT